MATDDDGIESARLVRDVHAHRVGSEVLCAAGLERRGEDLVSWAERQGHHVGRVLAAWQHGDLFIRGHGRDGFLRCTLKRDLDPAFLNYGARKHPDGEARSEFKQSRYLKHAEAEHDAAVAEAAEHDDDDDMMEDAA